MQYVKSCNYLNENQCLRDILFAKCEKSPLISNILQLSSVEAAECPVQ